MSKTHEISRDKWDEFFRDVSSLEKDHKVRIESETLDFGDEELANNVPFVGLACEKKGSEANCVDLIVAPGGRDGDYTHHIPNPKSVYAEEDDDGHLQCIDVEGDGMTLIYFD